MPQGCPPSHQDQEWHDKSWRGWRDYSGQVWPDNSWQQDLEWRDNSWQGGRDNSWQGWRHNSWQAWRHNSWQGWRDNSGTGWQGNSWDPQSRTTLGGRNGAGNATAVVDNPGWDQWPVTVADNATTAQIALFANAPVAGVGHGAAVTGVGNGAVLDRAAVVGAGSSTDGAADGAAVAPQAVPQSIPNVFAHQPIWLLMGADGAAVAGAGNAGGTAGPIFDLEYFRNRPFLTRGTWTDTYKQHNVALKYFRDSAEKEGLDVVNFSNTDPDPVAQIVHEKGMSYHFVGEPRIPWRWQEMVAQMTDDSMRSAVQGLGGPTGRSRGIVSCRLQRFDRYDHKRHYAERHPEQGKGKHATQSKPPPRAKEKMLVTWDFVLVCDDGTWVCLHPNFKDPKIACYTGEGVQDHEIPNTGKGGSSGKGTYQYFKKKHYPKTLTFDQQKCPS